MTNTEATKKKEMSIEERLIALYSLQKIDSEIDRIRIIHGELPLEVEDLEDEITGLETRVSRYQEDIKAIELAIREKRDGIKQCDLLIKRYQEQQNNVLRYSSRLPAEYWQELF